MHACQALFCLFVCLFCFLKRLLRNVWGKMRRKRTPDLLPVNAIRFLD